MPEKMKIHFRDGSIIEQDAIDARKTLRDHPEEYQTSPFPESVQKASKADYEAMRDHLDKLAAEGKTDREIERARHAWEGQQKWKKPVDAPKPAASSTTEPVAPYMAKEKTGGWWAIFDANNAQVGGNMRKPEADAFNAKSDDEKAEAVKAELAKG
ncbi:hypothetical protein FHT78_005431 [Rhizobium sp. BK196]|uniref:hypothetical protein n=1 Tax=Rhizobium sp. BK196 TaxID=2587073 RepID=UPI00161269D3|nr:hypothetical protein [Rhizobium sp. BK196]MBB3313637.1 hypothetical protein [Rhizobium sp. BK196]